MSIQQFFDDKKAALFFIELNKDIQVGQVTLPKGLDLPVDQNSIHQVADAQSEGFDLAEIVKDMCMIIGLDPDFKHAPTYRLLLNQLVSSPFGYCMHLGIEASEGNEFLDALLYFRAAQTIEQHIDVYYNLGKAYYALSHDETYSREALKLAESSFNQALQIENKAEIYYYLTFVAYQTQRYQMALNYAKTALSNGLIEVYAQDLVSKMSKIEDKAQFEMGYQFVLDERYQEGLERLEMISDEGEDDWRVQFFKGLAYRGMNMMLEAIQELLKAKALNPSEDRILNELGIVAMLSGDLDAAKLYFMEGLSFKPLNAEILCNLAILHIELDAIELATKFLSEAFAIDPEDAIILQTHRYMNTLKETNHEANNGASD